MPLHIFWDSNVLRIASLQEVDKAARDFPKRHPRSSFPELEEHPAGRPDFFRDWARESHQIAADWAYDVQTVSDPNKDQDADRLVKAMVNFILNGVSPVEEAPEVPAEYWKKLKRTTEPRITLAGYRIADLVIAAADNIESQRAFIGR